MDREGKDYSVTVLLSDLDNPCITSGTFNEWCHWLLYILNNSRCDLKLKNGQLKINGGGSRYFTQDSEFESTVVENEKTMFDYVPLHPNMSNPKQTHRYVLSVWKQPVEKLVLNPDSINQGKQEINNNSNIEYSARRIGSSYRFGKLNNLELVGVGHFTSSYTPDCSKIITSLGLHESVYGKIIGDAQRLVQKIQSTTEIALNNPNDIKAINFGKPGFVKFPKIPTINDKKAAGISVDRFEVEKKEKLSLIGQVGVVKSRKGDIANEFKGEITKRVTLKKNRYEYA